ncbi:MAG: hypothetical protein MUO63_11235 [Desulfobulbaceae bacterium]|nr:hypothetical protein [Desulfobulbaceae bacterium]
MENRNKFSMVFREYRSAILYFFVGALAGFFIFHPYTMAVYWFTHSHVGSMPSFQDLFSITDPSMTLMSVAFALFGSFVGFFAGLTLDKQRKLYASELESVRKQVALETLQTLMVTLSHYLLNSNTVIGGMAKRCRNYKTREEMLNALSLIEAGSAKIEAVVMALRRLTAVKTTHYTSEGESMMVDISREIHDLVRSQELNFGITEGEEEK